MLARLCDGITWTKAWLVLPREKFAMFERGLDVSHTISAEGNMPLLRVEWSKTFRFWWTKQTAPSVRR